MTKKISKSFCVLAAGTLTWAAGSAVAQNGAEPGVHDSGHPRVNEVNQPEQNQQKRIANGVKNDRLNPSQTANLERREAGLENQEKKDMAEHNGHLTKAEQHGFNQRENRISHSISKDKHK